MDCYHGTTLEFCLPRDLRLLYPYLAVRQASSWEEVSSAIGWQPLSLSEARSESPIHLYNSGADSGVTGPRVYYSCCLEAGSLPAQLAQTVSACGFRVHPRSTEMVSGWQRGESQELGSPAYNSPSARILHCLFAFLPGNLTSIIEISIHFCNKYVLRDCSKYWWRSWRQDDRSLTFRRLKGEVCAQTQWVPIQVPKPAL